MQRRLWKICTGVTDLFFLYLYKFYPSIFFFFFNTLLQLSLFQLIFLFRDKAFNGINSKFQVVFVSLWDLLNISSLVSDFLPLLRLTFKFFYCIYIYIYIYVILDSQLKLHNWSFREIMNGCDLLFIWSAIVMKLMWKFKNEWR